ncbi:MAG: Sec translocon accessory complex subunit YajC [Wolbachia endosymbiont of Ctenocephalides orientis wCori]|nr:MAG: Sec translocon accessory complex subunit YajC [Wolbachia endosymbiont of Ctenocephalides orientis wCori]
MVISEAFAADPSASAGAPFFSLIPWVLMFAVFYFLIIRPQHKKLKEHRNLVNQIKRGDTVITSGGIIGEVSKVDEANAQFIVEIAPKVEVKILKSSIAEVMNKEVQKVAAKEDEIEKDNKKNKEEEKKGKESKAKNAK